MAAEQLTENRQAVSLKMLCEKKHFSKSNKMSH